MQLKEIHMTIKLSYFINKKNISLDDYCKINNITSYEALLKNCKERGYLPVTQEIFDKEVIKHVKVVIHKNETQNKKKTYAKRGRPRKKQKK